MGIFSKNQKSSNVDFPTLIYGFCTDSRNIRGEALNQMLHISEVISESLMNEDQTKSPSPIAKLVLRELRHRLRDANLNGKLRALILLKVLVDNTPERFLSVLVKDQKLITILRDTVQKSQDSDVQPLRERTVAVFAHMAYRFKDDPVGSQSITDVYNSEMRFDNAAFDGQPFPENLLLVGLTDRQRQHIPKNPVEQQAALLYQYSLSHAASGFTQEQIAQEVTVAQSNAQIFVEALLSTPLDQLETNEILQEFLTAVKASQEKILGLIASVPDSPGHQQKHSIEQLTSSNILDKPVDIPQGFQGDASQPLQPTHAPQNAASATTVNDADDVTAITAPAPAPSPPPIDNNPFRDPELLNKFEQVRQGINSPPIPASTTSKNPILNTLLAANEQLHKSLEQYKSALERRDTELAVKSVQIATSKGKGTDDGFIMDDYGYQAGSSSKSTSESHVIV